MTYRVGADAVVAVHVAFILFVALGGFIALRWRPVIWAHVAAVAWGMGIIAVGWSCPLTAVERWLRRRTGETGGEGGFVDRYLEGVLFPGSATPWLRALAAVLIALSWWRVARGVRRAPDAAPNRPAGSPAPRPSARGRSCTARRS